MDRSPARLSHHDYEVSRRLAAEGPPFYALIAAAMRGADTFNMSLLREAFPQIAADLQARYDAPGGRLVGDS